MNRIAALLLISAVAAPASAADKKDFSVNGEILPGVCNVDFPPVELGSHSASLFTGDYETDFVDFIGTVSDCDPLVRRVAMRFEGLADKSNPSLFLGVDGVGIQLVRVASTIDVPIPPNSSSQFATAAGDYEFRARFKQSLKSVAAGRVQRTITVSLSYN